MRNPRKELNAEPLLRADLDNVSRCYISETYNQALT